MTKRIFESATLLVDPANNAFRVCLISEGRGSSADFPREFFTAENAARLGGSLSFPGHPANLWAPETRDPMSAIGQIAEEVTVEENDGLMGLWSKLIPSKSKPEVEQYIAEFGTKLGMSVYSDSNGREDPDTGRWIAQSFTDIDPYRSVDLVVAGGRGGKIEGRVAEGLLLLSEASATAGEKKGFVMDKDVEARFDALSKVVEGLVDTLKGKATADLQVVADDAAVAKTVESRFADYDKAVTLISEAKLTESQSADLRALAKTGVDITPNIETAKKVLAEALALSGASDDDARRISEGHLGDRSAVTSVKSFSVPDFGRVAS